MPTLILQHPTVSLLPRDFDCVADADGIAAQLSALQDWVRRQQAVRP